MVLDCAINSVSVVHFLFFEREREIQGIKERHARRMKATSEQSQAMRWL